MENKKCTSESHEEINAISFCSECKIYMCNKCDKIHSNLIKNHHTYNLNENVNEIFTGICKEEKHNIEIEFFCKTHNLLCCSSCITKIKDDYHGKHTDCEVCLITNIKEEKRNKLKDNIKYLEDLSISLEDSIKKLKNIFEKINSSKEELKINIQKIFTQIRNTLSTKEDELLLEVDSKFNELFFDEEFINKSEKLPDKIKFYLQKSKSMDKEWNNENKLNLLINDCINIENDIKNINLINEKINKYNDSTNFNLDFYPNKENELDDLLKNIKSFRIIHSGDYFYDSLILKNNNIYKNRLKEWINSSNNISTKLLYRKSRDGDEYKTFHYLCDNKGATIVLIKATEGFIIGGYTPLNWKSEGGWIQDNKTFVFSLSGNQVYRKKNKLTNSIYCRNDIDPLFNYIGFNENGKKNLSQGVFNTRSDIYLNNYNEIISKEEKNRFFDVEEVEIYQIESI